MMAMMIHSAANKFAVYAAKVICVVADEITSRIITRDICIAGERRLFQIQVTSVPRHVQKNIDPLQCRRMKKAKIVSPGQCIDVAKATQNHTMKLALVRKISLPAWQLLVWDERLTCVISELRLNNVENSHEVAPVIMTRWWTIKSVSD